MPLLQSLHHPILCSSSQNPKSNPNPSLIHPTNPFSSSSPEPLAETSTTSKTLDWILSVVNFLKSKGFSNYDFPRLSCLAPSVFFSSTDIDHTLSPVFSFLYNVLSASPQQPRGLVLRCPNLLAPNATYRLRPTFDFLRELGIENLNAPTNLNAHLLNTPVEKLVTKIEFGGLAAHERGSGRGLCSVSCGFRVQRGEQPEAKGRILGVRDDEVCARGEAVACGGELCRGTNIWGRWM